MAADDVSVSIASTGLDGQKVRLETSSQSYGTLKLPLLGAHQVENLAVSAAACDILTSMGIDISARAFKDGVAALNWPGRMQLLSKDPPVLLDGAHNAAAAKVLARSLRKELGFKSVAFVLGMCADKDTKSFLREVQPIAGKIWVVPVANERGSDPALIAAACRELGIDSSTAEPGPAVTEAKKWALDNDSAVCITGSLFLVGEVLEVGYGE
jgi:dihydrofolate synthase/folylpolyglutamate synthase